MNLLPETAEIQNQLAEYCKTGDYVELPGVNHKHIVHYRRLVYNVVDSTMKQAFPITYKIVEDKEWENMVDDFFRNNDCQTPQVWKLPYEFYIYAKSKNYNIEYGRPYLTDLLYFEWIEIEVHTMPDKKYIDILGLNKKYLANQEYRLLNLEYPVHLYKATEAEKMKGKYFILVFRESNTGKVKFFDLSLLHAYVFELLFRFNDDLKSIINKVKHIFKIKDNKGLEKSINLFIKDLAYQGMLLNKNEENN